jgi:CheY-like chemotaxis protein
MKPLILVVDDDEDDLWLMQKVMVEIGSTCQLNPFSDAASLLTYLDSTPTVPSLILIDYHLPRMDAMELTELLRSRPALKTVPFAWMSSEIDPAWEARCRDLDVSRCWVKPTDYAAWQAFVQQLCDPLFASRLR